MNQKKGGRSVLGHSSNNPYLIPFIKKCLLLKLKKDNRINVD